MTTLRELSVEEVASILSRGKFEGLISTVEHVQLECKNGLYDTKTVNSKIELAKDVSALANSSGGYLLIGPATKRNSLHQSDEVVSVSTFPSSAFHPDTYRNILRTLIYPPITDIKIQWHPSSMDPAIGIASIYVPPKSANEKPFLVAQSELDSRVRGHLFGYFERVGDDALPTTVQILRDMMKDGKRYGDLERRMENLEGLIRRLAVSPTVNNKPVNNRRLLLQRAADAKIAAQLSDVPSFFLIAAPSDPVELKGLFSARSPEYRTIAEPHAYRTRGFDINPHNPIQHLRGELIRRVASGRKGLELWRDGILVFVGRNDEDFLGWARKRNTDEDNIYINNYVLTEVIALFVTNAIQIFNKVQNAPEKIEVSFGLTREQTWVEIDGIATTYELSEHPISQYGSYPGHKAPASGDKNFWIDFPLKGAIAEVEALRLLKEIYHWFGITDEQIPYVDSASVPERVDLARYSS